MGIDKNKEKDFLNIYNENSWGDKDSKSGPGSNLLQTEAIRKTLPSFIEQKKIKTILDIPCGDFYWMNIIKADLSKVIDHYIGGEIVNELVQNNNSNYADSKFKFQLLDVTRSNLPKVDMIFCRDCLVHLSYEDIFLALKSIKKSGSNYLLTTSFLDSSRKNKNIVTGDWRPLNFQKFPFLFSPPSDMIIEECTEDNGIYKDKSLVLWKISKLNLSVLRFWLMLKKVKTFLRFG